MKPNTKRFITISVFLAIIIFLAWYFSYVVFYFVIALILTLLGSPIYKLINKIRIKKFYIPSSLNAFFTLTIMISLITLFFYIFIPLLNQQLVELSRIDTQLFYETLDNWLNNTEHFLKRNGFIEQEIGFQDLIVTQFNKFKSMLDFSTIINNFTSIVGETIIGLFTVIFITFFSLKDNDIIFKTILKFIPITLKDSFNIVVSESKQYMINYFTGLLLEMLIIGILYGSGCYFLGIQNALIIAFLFAMLIIVPYIGPIIALLLSMILAIAGVASTYTDSTVIYHIIFKLILLYGIIEILDKFLLQPFIFAKSVKTHPLEIFLIILIAGNLWGITGLIIAIPLYTIFRIIIKVFFGQYFYYNTKKEKSKTQNTTLTSIGRKLKRKYPQIK